MNRKKKVNEDRRGVFKNDIKSRVIDLNPLEKKHEIEKESINNKQGLINFIQRNEARKDKASITFKDAHKLDFSKSFDKNYLEGINQELKFIKNSGFGNYFKNLRKEITEIFNYASEYIPFQALLHPEELKENYLNYNQNDFNFKVSKDPIFKIIDKSYFNTGFDTSGNHFNNPNPNDKIENKNPNLSKINQQSYSHFNNYSNENKNMGSVDKNEILGNNEEILYDDEELIVIKRKKNKNSLQKNVLLKNPILVNNTDNDDYLNLNNNNYLSNNFEINNILAKNKLCKREENNPADLQVNEQCEKELEFKDDRTNAVMRHNFQDQIFNNDQSSTLIEHFHQEAVENSNNNSFIRKNPKRENSITNKGYEVTSSSNIPDPDFWGNVIENTSKKFQKFNMNLINDNQYRDKVNAKYIGKTSSFDIEQHNQINNFQQVKINKQEECNTFNDQNIQFFSEIDIPSNVNNPFVVGHSRKDGNNIQNFDKYANSFGGINNANDSLKYNSNISNIKAYNIPKAPGILNINNIEKNQTIYRNDYNLCDEYFNNKNNNNILNREKFVSNAYVDQKILLYKEENIGLYENNLKYIFNKNEFGNGYNPKSMKIFSTDDGGLKIDGINNNFDKNCFKKVDKYNNSLNFVKDNLQQNYSESGNVSNINDQNNEVNFKFSDNENKLYLKEKQNENNVQKKKPEIFLPYTYYLNSEDKENIYFQDSNQEHKNIHNFVSTNHHAPNELNFIPYKTMSKDLFPNDNIKKRNPLSDITNMH